MSWWTISILLTFYVAGAHGSEQWSQAAGPPSSTVTEDRGIALGVDFLEVPDVAAARLLVGPSDRVESGNVDSYIATYSPEQKAGYYAVTTDQGLAIEELRARASALDLLGAKDPTLGSTSERPHATMLVFSKYSNAQIESSLAQLRKAVQSAGVSASFYYEVSQDSIVLAADPSETLKIPVTPVEVQVIGGEVIGANFAEDMRSPFRGGGTLYNSGRGRCTSGIPAYNSRGSAGYFTAAHCYTLGTTVYSSSWLSGASITWSVTHRFGTDVVDAEFVSGSAYTGHVFTTDTTSLRIAGTYFPAAGEDNRLCFSGSTMGKRCDNNLITYGGDACYAVDGTTERCYSNMIALRGGTAIQRGNSGGPVYGTFGTTLKVSGIVAAFLNPFIGEYELCH